MKWLLSNKDFGAAVADNNDWLFDILWDNGIISEENAVIQFICASGDYDAPDCPFCGASDNRHYPLSDNRWKCKKCLKKFSLTSGRYINNTKLPITHWWRFCWLVCHNKKISSNTIARDLGITQDTAWNMLKTLKDAMKASGVVMVNGSIDLESKWAAMKLLMRPIEMPTNEQTDAHLEIIEPKQTES